jgi:nucleolar protein 4
MDELGMHDSQSDEYDSESNEEDEEESVKPQLPLTETGTTVFIRNVPFDATEDDLRTLCVSFLSLFFRLAPC